MSKNSTASRWHTVRSAGVARTAALSSALTASAAIVFLLTAAIGVTVAYDRPAAMMRFALIAIAFIALLLAFGLSKGGSGPWVSGMLADGSALAGALVSVYFLLSFGWQDAESQYALLGEMGQRIADLRPVLDMPDTVNANVAGSALVILILVGLGGLFWSLRRRKVWARVSLVLLTLPALLLSGLALVMTESRGAWISGATGIVAFVFLLWLTGADHRRPVRIFGYLLVGIAAILLAGAIAFVVVAPSRAGELISLTGATWSGRAQLWHDAQALLGDYRYTGSGLGSTMMVYSTYYLLLHVGYTSHMHNLYLEIAVQQGLPGLIAFLCLSAGLAAMLIAAMTEGPRGRRRLAAGALAALIAILVHGMVDAGLYASRLVPLLFLPLLVAWPIRLRRRADDPTAWGRLSFAGAVLPLALVVLPLLLPGSRAGFQANLGAVEQTVAELSLYDWPAYPLQDELRRNGDADLSRAEARYRASLVLDPDNVTAHQRLGQIALARGEIDAAREHLEAAYAASPERKSVRQLLGEVVAIQDDPVRAADLWNGLDFGAGQLTVRHFWYEHVQDRESLARFEAAVREWNEQQDSD